MDKCAHELNKIAEERTEAPSLDKAVLSSGHVKTAGEQFGEILNSIEKAAFKVPRKGMIIGSGLSGAVLGGVLGAGTGAAAGGVTGKPGERGSSAGKGALLGALTGATAGGVGLGRFSKHVADFADNSMEYIQKTLPRRAYDELKETAIKKPEKFIPSILKHIPDDNLHRLDVKDYVGPEAEKSLRKMLPSALFGVSAPGAVGIGTGAGVGLHSRYKKDDKKPVEKSASVLGALSGTVGGAITGSLLGAGAGAITGKSGERAEAAERGAQIGALTGAGIGGVSSGVAGRILSKADEARIAAIKAQKRIDDLLQYTSARRTTRRLTPDERAMLTLKHNALDAEVSANLDRVVSLQTKALMRSGVGGLGVTGAGITSGIGAGIHSRYKKDDKKPVEKSAAAAPAAVGGALTGAGLGALTGALAAFKEKDLQARQRGFGYGALLGAVSGGTVGGVGARKIDRMVDAFKHTEGVRRRAAEGLLNKAKKKLDASRDLLDEVELTKSYGGFVPKEKQEAVNRLVKEVEDLQTAAGRVYKSDDLAKQKKKIGKATAIAPIATATVPIGAGVLAGRMVEGKKRENPLKKKAGLATNILAPAGAGAVIGGLTGEGTEKRMRNALIGAGLGAGLGGGTTAIHRKLRSMKRAKQAPKVRIDDEGMVHFGDEKSR